MSEEKQTIHVLLVYPPENDDTYVHVFKTKQGVKDFLEQTIRDDFKEMYGDDMDDDEHREMEVEVADMKRAMDEDGEWQDYNDYQYDYQEREFEDPNTEAKEASK